MKASDAKAMAQVMLLRVRSTKLYGVNTSMSMYCQAQIAATALSGITQMTIDLSPVFRNAVVDISPVVKELTDLGYSVHQVGDTRLYVSWENA